jgi:Tfp pilus assembly PilM family ATPase
MKIAVECKSPLLQKSLELFLDRYLTTSSRCDIIVSDVECLNDKRCFYIGTGEKVDLLKPFSKSQLILALEKRYEESKPKVETTLIETQENETLDFDILEKRIESLTQEYQSNILRAVKAFYEK